MPGGRRSCSRGAWLATHWLLRESAIWRDRNTDEVRGARRDADYAYRLAVDPPASKELRLFGLVDWTIDRFVNRRTRLYSCNTKRPGCGSGPCSGSLLLVVAANVVVCWSLAHAAADGRIDLGHLVMFAQSAVGTSMIAFGGLNWALDGASAPVAAVFASRAGDGAGGRFALGNAIAPPGLPAREIRFRDVTFAYPGGSPVLEGFDLTIPAGSSLAIVGQNGAGKTTLAKLLCRLYDPQAGAIEVDGVDVREVRSRLLAFATDGRLSGLHALRVAASRQRGAGGAPDAAIESALASAGAAGLAGLDTVLARGYEGGTELSGGQWQRIALARALCAIQLGAGVVLLDEPTAQLDVRGEAEIFDRILAASRRCDHDPHLASIFDGAPRRPHLRPGARQGRRAGHARRADGQRGTLPHNVRPAGSTIHSDRGRGGTDL